MKQFVHLPAIIGTLPNTLTNGTTADATQVMADLNFIVNQVNANAAAVANTALTNANNNFTVVQSGIGASASANFPIASQVQNSAFQNLTSTLGTNSITARCAALPLGAYVSGQVFTLIPSQPNTGPANITVDAAGSSIVFSFGSTLVGGDFIPLVPARLEFDGFKMNYINPTPPYPDNIPIQRSALDRTKTLRFNLANLSASATRVVSAPDRDLTLNDLGPLSNSLSGNVSLNNTASYFTGPTVAQGTAGTWFFSGTVAVTDSAGGSLFSAKLTDGTTVIASTRITQIAAANAVMSISLSGFLTSPAGNVSFQVKDESATTGTILSNTSGNGKDSTLTAFRIG